MHTLAVVRFALLIFSIVPALAAPAPPVQKLKDIVIYEDPAFYSSFPSIVRRPDGELLVAFRRAPERRRLGEKNVSHTDPNSYLMLVRSRDGGESWSRQPELLYAHPFGGSQDPCLLQLNDGTLLCSSYGWALLNPDYAATLTNSPKHGNFVFMGGYVLRSRDGARSWQALRPPHVEEDTSLDFFGRPISAFNRGALIEGKDHRVYWAVAANSRAQPRQTHTCLLISADQGETWEQAAVIARDDKITFNETSLYETPKGDLVAFLRTANFDDHTVVARSTDHGKTFAPWEDAGFQGHPHFALRLPKDRVLLIYGYRHPPFGIRARVLDAECRDFKTAEEIVLRDDGGSGDLGYPWATLLSKKKALVVYYFNRADGTRHIAGTVLGLN